jgi:hypothetical protein
MSTSEVATAPAPDPTFNGLWTENWHCQFCGEHADDYYMIQPELWQRIIGKPYHYGSGLPALFAPPTGSIPVNCAMRTSTIRVATKMRVAGSIYSGSGVAICPVLPHTALPFPKRAATRVRITVDDDNWGWPNDEFDLLEALEDERFGWLWEYVAAHSLKVQWLDDAIYQPRFEGKTITIETLSEIR